MKSKVCFLGAPSYFSTYPNKDEDSYYNQFYDTSHKQPWQFLIRQHKNIVRYIYIRYGLVSGADEDEPGRGGRLCGFSLELEDYYLNCTVTTLLPFFHKFYEHIVKDEILLKKEEAVHFQVKDFRQVSNYLNDRIAALKQIPYRLSDNLVKLETNLDVYAPPKITQFGNGQFNDEALNEAFTKVGWINIIPKLPAKVSSDAPTYILPSEKEQLDIENERLRQENKELKQTKNMVQKNNTSKKTRKRKQKLPIGKIIGTLIFLALLGAAGYGTGVFEGLRSLSNGNDSSRENYSPPIDSSSQATSRSNQESSSIDCSQPPLVQEARQLRNENSYAKAIEKLEQAQTQNPKCKEQIANLVQEYKVARERHTKKTILHYINNEVYTEKKTDRYVKWSRRINWFSKANNLLGNHRIYAQYHAERKYDKIKCGYYLKITYPEKAKDCE